MDIITNTLWFTIAFLVVGGLWVKFDDARRERVAARRIAYARSRAAHPAGSARQPAE